MLALPHAGAAAADEAAAADQVGATRPSVEDEERRELLEGEEKPRGDTAESAASSGGDGAEEGEETEERQAKIRQLQIQRMQVEHRRYIKRMRLMEKLYGKLGRVRYIISMGIALLLSGLLLLSLFFLLSVLWDPTKYGLFFAPASLLVKSFGGAVFMIVVVGMILSISMVCIFRVGTLLFFLSFYIKSFLFSVLLASVCSANSGLLQTTLFSSDISSPNVPQFNSIPYFLLALALLTHGVCTATPHLWAWILLPLMIISQTLLILFFHPSLVTPPLGGLLGSFFALIGSSPSWIAFSLLTVLHTFRAGLYCNALNFKNQLSFFFPPNACIIQPPSPTVSPPKALHNAATVPSPLITQPQVQSLASEHKALQKEGLISSSLQNTQHLTISELAGSADQSTVPLPPPQPSSGAPTSAADFLAGPPNAGVDSATTKNDDVHHGQKTSGKKSARGGRDVIKNAGERRKKRTESFRTFLRKIIWRHLVTALGCGCLSAGIVLVSIHLGKNDFRLTGSAVQLLATPQATGVEGAGQAGRSFLHLHAAPGDATGEDQRSKSDDGDNQKSGHGGMRGGDGGRMLRFFRRRNEGQSLSGSEEPIRVPLPTGFIEEDTQKFPNATEEEHTREEQGFLEDTHQTIQVYVQQEGDWNLDEKHLRPSLRSSPVHQSPHALSSFSLLRPTSLALASSFSPSFLSSDILFHQFANRESSQQEDLRSDGGEKTTGGGREDSEAVQHLHSPSSGKGSLSLSSFLHLGTTESDTEQTPAGQPAPSILLLMGLLMLGGGGVLSTVQLVWLLSTWIDSESLLASSPDTVRARCQGISMSVSVQPLHV